MKRLAIVSILVLGAVFLFSEKLRSDRQSELDASIAREIELRKIQEGGVGDPYSPTEILKNPPSAPIEMPPPLPLPPSSRVGPAVNSDRLEHDQMRREIDSLRRQADLDRMNRDIERREAEESQRKRDRERILGLNGEATR